MEKEKSIEELTADELRTLLVAKERKEKAARERAKKAYEKERDSFVRTIIVEAIEVHKELREFKERLHKAFEKHQVRLNEYGQIRGNSKGGFSITTADGRFRAKRIRSTSPNWDERSEKALSLLSDFLQDTVKKRDQKLYEILITFIQRNENGELEYAKVMHLLQHKDKYDDPRWLEGLKLIKESYNVQLRGYGYEFYVRNEETSKFDKIEINFTSL